MIWQPTKASYCWPPARTRPSWRATRFAVGGFGWAKRSMRMPKACCCWPIAAGATGIACRCSASDCAKWPRACKFPFECPSAAVLLEIQSDRPSLVLPPGPFAERCVCRSVENVRDALVGTTTSTGLRVVVEIARRVYQSGVKASEHFRNNEPIIRHHHLSAFNYTAPA